MKDLRILPEVATDVSEAANWCDEERCVGLGDRFITTYYVYLSHVQQSGEIYRMVYSEFRRILLRPFPYALYYRYVHDLVVVSLVILAAQSPRRVRDLFRQRQK